MRSPADLTEDQRLLLALNIFPAITWPRIQKLRQHFGSLQNAVAQPVDDLVHVLQTKSRLFANYFNADALRAFADDELKAAEKLRLSFAFMGDVDYPLLLSEIPDPPLVLYIEGTLSSEDVNAVAVVGTRNADDLSLTVARQMAQAFSTYHVTTISGGAVGVDRAAHQGALQGPGRTLWVSVAGLDVVYPAHRRELGAQIRERGAILSESPLGRRPEKGLFQARNRIVAGLSLGVVMVEGAEHSGSLITTRLANEYNRQVMVVPTHPSMAGFGGNAKLLRQGATPVFHAADVLDTLKSNLQPGLVEDRPKEKPKLQKSSSKSKQTKPSAPQTAPRAPKPQPDHEINKPDLSSLPEAQQTILKILRNEGDLHVDFLAEKAALDVSEFLQALMRLELQGLIDRRADGTLTAQ